MTARPSRPATFKSVKKGIAALPCGIDKYNSYRKYGETLQISQTSKLGVFRTGLWYEWARTNRHQYPSDPLNNWADQPLPKFNESFWTNSYQPYAEYEFHVTPQAQHHRRHQVRLLTPSTSAPRRRRRNRGRDLPCASTTAACSATVTNTGSFYAWLPSLDVNYRIQPDWSVYAQVGDRQHRPAQHRLRLQPDAGFGQRHCSHTRLDRRPSSRSPPPTRPGRVFKGQSFTFDADGYRIRFQNSYSSVTDPGDHHGERSTICSPVPSPRALNSKPRCSSPTASASISTRPLPRALLQGRIECRHVDISRIREGARRACGSQTSHRYRDAGLTYQAKGLDLGFFNKRIGEERVDNVALITTRPSSPPSARPTRTSTTPCATADSLTAPNSAWMRPT